MSDAPAQQITDFEDLYAREVEFTVYRVLSLGGETATAYDVDIKALTCDCTDEQMRRDGPEICKHLAVALYQAREHPAVEEHYMDWLSTDVRQLRAAVDDIKQSTTAVKADATAAASGGAQEPAGDDGGDVVDDPVAMMQSLLKSKGLPPEEFDIFVDKQYGSLQIEVDGYLDSDDFDTWVEFSDEIGLKYDGDADRNYLPAEDFEGVLG